MLTNNNNNGINNLRDICNFLPVINATIPTGGCPYDHIIEMMRGLDLQDDGIIMNQKIRAIELDFCNIVRDENMLCESMEYINEKALSDGETSLKFALLFSSRIFDALAMKETKVRSAMLKILETNFLNADTYRLQDKERLYNSITLLGEYYYRVRLADNSPITILGESLLALLIREVCALDVIEVRLAKLILSQITLNGDILRVKHKAELRQLLFHLRRNLIEQPALSSAVKALLLMTLDLYYSNFANLGAQLEEMYTKYLMQQQDDDEGNNNLESQQQQQQQQQQILLVSPQNHQQSQIIYQTSQTTTTTTTAAATQQQQQQQLLQSYTHPEVIANTSDISYENGASENSVNDSFEVQPLTKKWSEQVCEESFFESEFNAGCDGENIVKAQERISSNSSEQIDQTRNNRRSYPRNSPRPLKTGQTTTEFVVPNQQQQPPSAGEERDQSKPLPRWRATRFNRDGGDAQERLRNNHHHRRFSGNFEEDLDSVRSEGGSIRLYSINDRLKHSQEKIERSSGNNYNSIANSNWDQQSLRDDRSERSYNSNFERGVNNNRRGGGHGRHFNNRQNYDKPPRFQKHQHQQHQNQQQQQQQQQQHKDNHKIHSETWRRSHVNTNNSSSFEDKTSTSSLQSNGPESNSRSSSRARTLPRPAKSSIDDTNLSSYRGSQSPTRNQHYQRGSNARSGGGGGGQRNYNGRYSSQSSLASETSSTLDRRHNQRNRNFGRRSSQQEQQQRQQQQQEQQKQVIDAQQQNKDWEDTRSVHGQPEEASWDTHDNNSELVRNARQTTKYMNYLSSQK